MSPSPPPPAPPCVPLPHRQSSLSPHPGLLLMLLVAGGVVAALVVLGAVLWGLSRCRRVDSGESTCPGESHLTGAEGISVHGATAATWQMSELQHPAKRAGGGDGGGEEAT